MGKIQELSELLANQIAAGEVVERPASVIKELIENAIDAGSTQIDIAVEESGMRKIQIVDNGEGMAPDDVESAFKRHATSKIHTRDDLFRIRTLGFRGEALPSIASVSEIILETSTGDAEGTAIELKGGKIVSKKPHAMRKGTKIMVENLFYNTPARLKYVKSMQTELAKIGDIVNRLALSHPHIAFRLMNDGNKMLTTAGNGDLKQTIAGIYGVSSAKKMLAIDSENLDFKVSGYVSLPELTRAGRNYLSIIVNGRYIRNYQLNKAIVDGYGSKLMIGRFPIAVIEITMDPLLVDVNVHPTKQEVRLSKEDELMELISAAIRDKLVEERLIPSAADNLSFKKETALEEKAVQERLDITEPEKRAVLTPEPQFPWQKSSDNPGLGYDQTTGTFFAKNVVQSEKAMEIAEEKVEIETPIPAPVPAGKSSEPAASFAWTAEQILADDGSWLDDPFGEEAEVLVPVTEEELDREKPAQRFPTLEYFGQMHGTYLFAQSKEGLYIIDQHAAQERVKYEYFREKIGEVTNDQQELLIPIVLEFSNNEAILLREKSDLLTAVGIHLEDFGNNSFVVRSHPTWYPRGEEETMIRGMLEMLLEKGSVSIAKFREATAIMMSCKGSIKANHYLNETEARTLLKDLATCENPFNCPHGRPVLVQFSNKDMEKMFKRIQDPH